MKMKNATLAMVLIAPWMTAEIFDPVTYEDYDLSSRLKLGRQISECECILESLAQEATKTLEELVRLRRNELLILRGLSELVPEDLDVLYKESAQIPADWALKAWSGEISMQDIESETVFTGDAARLEIKLRMFYFRTLQEINHKQMLMAWISKHIGNMSSKNKKSK